MPEGSQDDEGLSGGRFVSWGLGVGSMTTTILELSLGVGATVWDFTMTTRSKSLRVECQLSTCC